MFSHVSVCPRGLPLERWGSGGGRPPSMQTPPRYGQPQGGKHRTGIHSCFIIKVMLMKYTRYLIRMMKISFPYPKDLLFRLITWYGDSAELSL